MGQDKNLTIGIFTDAYKPVVNGVVNAIENLYNTLLSLKHKIYIFAPAYPGYVDDCGDVYRFKSMRLSSRVDFPVAIPYSKKIFSIIMKSRLDIIHCHHPFLMGRVGQYFAGKLKIPLVATLHTQYENYLHYIPFSKSLVRKITLWALRDFSSKCNALIIPAESRKRQLEKYGISYKNIKVIPNGINIQQFSSLNGCKIRKKYLISEDEKLLIFVGRLAKEKNLHFLLDCFKLILKENPGVKLMLVGDGPERDILKNRVLQENIMDKVIFTGNIVHDFIADYYGAADIFVSASTTEVHPIVLLEAMAAGLPVVAVKSVGFEDTICQDREGFLCAEKEFEFSGAVTILLNDEFVRKNMSIAAHNRALEFSVDTLNNQIVDIYLSLARN